MTPRFAVLTRSDRDKIAQLQFDSWRASYRNVLPESYIEGEMRDDIARHWDSWSDDTWVAGAVDASGTLLGFAAYILRDPVYLDNFHVAARCHGSGLSAELFDFGRAQIVAPNGGAMWLTVLETNSRARAFYKKMGGTEGDVMEDKMLGHAVRAIPVHWSDEAGGQKNVE